MSYIKYIWQRFCLRCMYSSAKVDAYLAEHRGDMLMAADWDNEAHKIKNEIDILDMWHKIKTGAA